MTTTQSGIDLETLARQLWAIGDPLRLEILRLLPTEPDCADVCNVSKIAEQIGLSQPATSHHLRVLRQAGIITNRKMCRDMIYWVDLESGGAVCESLQELLTRGGCG